jgi:hypothetical protein
MNLLPKNENTLDRAVRVVLGVALLSQAFTGLHTIFGYIGIVPLATGLLGSCPLYTLFGWSTCAVPQTKA